MGGSWFRYLLAPIPRGRRSCTSCWEFDPAGFSKKRAFREYHLSVVFALVSCCSSLMVLSGCCSSTRERWRGVPLLCIHCARNVVARGRCRLCICVQGEARFTGSLPFHDPEEKKEKHAPGIWWDFSARQVACSLFHSFLPLTVNITTRQLRAFWLPRSFLFPSCRGLVVHSNAS